MKELRIRSVVLRKKTHYNKGECYKKFDNLIIEFPEVYHLLEQTEVSKTYSMPKSYISYRKLRRISEEQREKARNKMEKLNERKK